MLFCPEDKRLMVPGSTGNRCPRCGFIRSLGRDTDASRVEYSAGKTEIVVLEAKQEVLPKTKETCPSCGHGDAYVRTQQTRKSDEPETMFLRCAKCDHRWRRY